jgi:ATP-dependent DNA ligase
LGDRFPAIVDAARCLRATSFLIYGEAVICRPDGLSDFDALRVGRRAHEVTLAAFDLIELHGDDLRDEPLLKRKQDIGQRPPRLLSTMNTSTTMARACSNTPAVWAQRT